ncbi:MAG: hypothetical protein IJ703_01285 [Eubacterium sp.]|nr:hypothetical protein [Eubacterium sp.]
MEKVNAEEYLQTIRDLKCRIDALEVMRKDIKLNIGIIREGSNDVAVKKSPQRDTQEKQIIKNIEKLERLDRKIAGERTKYIIRRNAAFEQIMRLKDGQCRRFLIDFYVNGKSMIEIAYDYHYETTESIYNLKRRAVKYFSKNF